MTENTKKCHVLAPTLDAVGAMVFGVSVITIPVYNENFKRVIEKTLGEVEKLRAKYKGKVIVVVCDDGMYGKKDGRPICNKRERQERRAFYLAHGIVWVARPHGGRAGKFKKSSNLNGGLTFVEYARESNARDAPKTHAATSAAGSS